MIFCKVCDSVLIGTKDDHCYVCLFNEQEAATVAFQEKHGLTPDGLIGPKTRAKMREEEKAATKHWIEVLSDDTD